MNDKLHNDPITTDVLTPKNFRYGWRSPVIFILMVSMLASALFLPRAFLSVSMILFFLVSLMHRRVKEQLINFTRSPLLWGMSILFLLPLVSGLWSEDQKQWQNILRMKLPLVLMPLAFAGSFGILKKNWQQLAYIFIALVAAGTAWSMMQYLPDKSAVHAGYLRSTIIQTPLENDHVRFSWLVHVAILAAVWLFWKNKIKSSLYSWFMAAVAIWLILFLHILAARTGLLCFYLSLVIVAIWIIFKKAKPLFGAVLLISLFVLPVTAYLLLPTFQNRARYFLYDLSYFKKTQYLEGTNDATRVISLKAGWNIMNTYPLKGSGFGDLDLKSKEWYAVHYPQMSEADKILPSSEWLVYGAGCGWPGFIIFTFLMILPLVLKGIKNRLPWYLLSATTAFTLLFDIGLEVQFGVFLYSFIMLWWWKWMRAEK